MPYKLSDIPCKRHWYTFTFTFTHMRLVSSWRRRRQRRSIELHWPKHSFGPCLRLCLFLTHSLYALSVRALDECRLRSTERISLYLHLSAAAAALFFISSHSRMFAAGEQFVPTPNQSHKQTHTHDQHTKQAQNKKQQTLPIQA